MRAFNSISIDTFFQLQRQRIRWRGAKGNTNRPLLCNNTNANVFIVHIKNDTPRL